VSDFVAKALFKEVLDVCRAKSSRGASEWHRLRSDIEKYLREEFVDLEPYKPVKVVVRTRDAHISVDLQRENIRLNNQISRLRKMLDVFYAREVELKKVISRNIGNELRQVYRDSKEEE
jgi:hypothetical protein